MTIVEAGLGRNVGASEGVQPPLSEGQMASFRIIRSSLPSYSHQSDAPLSNIPFDVLSSMPRFPQIYSAVENIALFGYGGQENAEDRIKGIVFHQLAHASSTHARDNAGIILPEPVAFQIVQVLNPNSEVINDPFSPGIKGSYVPDALEVSLIDGRIAVIGYVEYSTVGNIHKFVDQIRAARKLTNQLGLLATDPEFVVVVPSDSNMLVPGVIAGTRIRKAAAAFSYQDIRDCIAYMTQTYTRDGDPYVATISDLVHED